MLYNIPQLQLALLPAELAATLDALTMLLHAVLRPVSLADALTIAERILACLQVQHHLQQGYWL